MTTTPFTEHTRRGLERELARELPEALEVWDDMCSPHWLPYDDDPSSCYVAGWCDECCQRFVGDDWRKWATWPAKCSKP